MAMNYLTGNYRTRLRDYIADRTNGLLLTAGSEGSAFELASGRYQRDYVTLWGLFDKPEFDECLARLAALALQIREKESWYSTIVTCTATAKHILEHLHVRLETAEDEVEVYYLAPYPFHTVEGNRLMDFQKKRVLIVADVVASGTLIKTLAAAVERLGGTPIGAISVVKIVENIQPTEDQLVSHVEFGTAGRSIPQYSLTDFQIPELHAGQFDLAKVRKINPATILPESLPAKASSGGFIPKFADTEAFRCFEETRALAFGLHEMDGRRFTTAFRLHALLDDGNVGWADRIWSSIESDIREGDVLATTYSRDDLTFYDFVKKRLDQASLSPMKPVFIPRSDSIDYDFPYFLMNGSQRELNGKRVILLASSIYRAENLRKLVSLLTLHRVRGITVICLLNRMGSRTYDFISRIRKLVRGFGQRNQTTFRFVPIFNIADLKGVDLVKMQQSVEALLSDYLSRTPEKGFQSLIEQEMRYFRPRSVTARRLELNRPDIANKSNELLLSAKLPTVKPTSESGKLYCLCSYAASTRDYRQIIAALQDETDKDTLYQLFAILLSDMSYLRITRQFEPLRDTLLKSLRKQRERRFDIEHNVPGAEGDQAIEDCVEIETFFLFGLALFSHLDQEYVSYREVIREVLTSGHRQPDEWNLHRRNFIAYYKNERVVWTLSLLLHFTQADYRNVDAKSEFKTSLMECIDQYFKYIEESEAELLEGDAALRSDLIRIKHNFDSLMKEFGRHELRRRHQVIRYLHSQLIEPKAHHNPIFKDLDRAYNELSNLTIDSQAASDSHRVPFLKDEPEAVRFKRTVEDAVYAASILEDITDAANRLFFFHPRLTGKDITRYVSGTGRAGLGLEANQLRTLLQDIRVSKAVSAKETDTFNNLYSRLREELDDAEKPLLEALLWYVTPLREQLRTAMVNADKVLEKEYGRLWTNRLSELDRMSETEVLIDPGLLREVVWNMCTNVRHGLKDLRDSGVNELSSYVDFEIIEQVAPAPPPEVDSIDYIVFRIFSPFTSFKSGNTFERHKLAVEQFGGKIEETLLEDERRLMVELRLISRQKVKEAWETKQEYNQRSE